MRTASTPTERRLNVYVSNSQDGNIRIFNLHRHSGELEARSVVAAGDTVMPLAIDAEAGSLYAAARGDEKSIVHYRIDPDSGDLTLLSRAAIDSSLAYLFLNAASQTLLGASYGEHRVTVYPVDRVRSGDGAYIQQLTDIKHAHSILSTKDGRFVYITALGSDEIHAYTIDANDRLVENGKVLVEDGFGPRHLCFSPSEDRLFVLGEFRATVAAFSIDRDSGQLVKQCTSCRPPVLAHLEDGSARPNFADPIQPDPAVLARQIWAADLHVTPDGRFLYLSERTTSRIIILRVVDEYALDYVGYVDTERQPRGFQVDPDGEFLVVCGERSPNIRVYRIDGNTGHLTPTSWCEGGRGANWVAMIAQP